MAGICSPHRQSTYILTSHQRIELHSQLETLGPAQMSCCQPRKGHPGSDCQLAQGVIQICKIKRHNDLHTSPGGQGLQQGLAASSPLARPGLATLSQHASAQNCTISASSATCMAQTWYGTLCLTSVSTGITDQLCAGISIVQIVILLRHLPHCRIAMCA